jgi:hypothetical protein
MLRAEVFHACPTIMVNNFVTSFEWAGHRSLPRSFHGSIFIAAEKSVAACTELSRSIAQLYGWFFMAATTWPCTNFQFLVHC